jgi:anaerobic magnesium-protoporphyrin IX monomethyl ester cyclase
MYDLDVTSPIAWKHNGMDSKTAERLRLETLRDVRWGNDLAVHDSWTLSFARPLVPGQSLARSQRVEKRLEQLAFLVKDHGQGEGAAARCRGILTDLQELGVQTSAEAG